MNNQYLTISSAQRREQLLGALKGASAELIRAADIFVAMEHTGDDTSFVPRNIKIALGRIASRTMLPEVMLEMGGWLRSRVMMLPIEKQREILDGKLIELVDGDTIRFAAARDLAPSEINQVFTESGSIRDPESQKIWLSSNETRPLKTKPARYKIKNGNVIVTAGILSAEDILKLAQTLNQP